MRSAGKLFAILMFATSTVGTAAQQGGRVTAVPPPASPIHFKETWRPTGSVDTEVVGTVVDNNKAPIANAHVQLRDLTTGRILAELDTNDLGEFAFKNVEPGTYVVEMVGPGEHVIALSNAASLAHDQRFSATVQLAGRWNYNTRSVVPSVNAAQFFGLGSVSSMTASTLSMAVASRLRPVDAGEPVSPH